MNAIDRERLLKWLKSLDSTYVTKEIIPQIESGAFDIKPPEVPDLQPGDKVRHKTKQTVYLGEIIGVAKGKARVRWMSFNTNVFWKRAPQPKWYAIEELVKVEDEHGD